MKQLLTRGAAVLVAAALVGLPTLAVDLTAQPKQIPPFDGVWKLNVEASTNPNGPPPPPPARGRGGRSGGRSSGAGVPSGVLLSVAALPVQGGAPSGAPSVGNEYEPTSLSSDEQVRFDAMRSFIYAAPPMMGVSATATDFTIILDPVKKLGFQHKLDNRNVTLKTVAGEGQFKARWDGTKIRREIETKDSLKMTEEYSLSPNNQQLIVVIKGSSSMVRMDNREVKRVYDRVATPAPAAQ
jgi:hypothetical protein